MRTCYLAISIVLTAICYQVAFARRGNVDFALLYFLALLAGNVVVGALLVRSDRKRARKSSNALPSRGRGYRLAGVLLILATVAAALARYPTVTKASVWLDEELQVAATVPKPPYFDNILVRAAVEQQPPLAYFMTGLTHQLFGYTEWGARAAPFALGTLATALCFLVAFSLTQNAWVSFFVALLFATNPALIRYSLEGRPIAAGVFFELLYFYALADFWRRKDDGEDQRLKLLSVALPATLFLYSTGFQPVIVIAVVSICALPLGSVLVGAHALAAALFAPVFVVMVKHSPTKFRTDSAAALKLALEKTANASELARFYERLGAYLPAALAACALAVAVIAFRKVRRRESLDRTSRAFLFGLGFSALFPFLFSLVFYFSIAWPLFPRYFQTLLPALILTMGCALAVIARVRLLAVAALALCLGAVKPQYNQALIAPYLERPNPEWRELYAYFKTEGNQGDAAYLIATCGLDNWTPNAFMMLDYYYPATGPRPVRLHNYWEQPWPQPLVGDLVLSGIKSAAPPDRVHLVLFNWPERNLPKVNGIAPRVSDYLITYSVSLPKGARRGAALLDFLTSLERALGPENDHERFVLHDLILQLALHENRKDLASRELEELKATRADKNMSERIASYEKTLRN